MAILGMAVAGLQGGLGQRRKVCARKGPAGSERTACPRPQQTSVRVIAAVEIVVKTIVSQLAV